jgi:hypothetical protein
VWSAWALLVPVNARERERLRDEENETEQGDFLLREVGEAKSEATSEQTRANGHSCQSIFVFLTMFFVDKASCQPSYVVA